MPRISMPPDFYRRRRLLAPRKAWLPHEARALSIHVPGGQRLAEQACTSAQWGPLMRRRWPAAASTVAELARWMQVDAGAMTRIASIASRAAGRRERLSCLRPSSI